LLLYLYLQLLKHLTDKVYSLSDLLPTCFYFIKYLLFTLNTNSGSKHVHTGKKL